MPGRLFPVRARADAGDAGMVADIDNRWIEDDRFAVLKVPNAVVPIAFDYVINPAHANFKQIEIAAVEHHAFGNRLSVIQH